MRGGIYMKHQISRRTKRNMAKSVKGIFLILYLIIVMFPFYWMLNTSLKSSMTDIYAFPVTYWPEQPSLVNYLEILWKGNFTTYVRNSFFYSMIASVAAVIVGLCASYVLSRFKFRGKKAVLIFSWSPRWFLYLQYWRQCTKSLQGCTCAIPFLPFLCCISICASHFPW